MKRILIGFLMLGLLLVVVPPLYYSIRPAPVHELPPAGERIAVADGVRVNAIVQGAGPPVVLVHGLPGSAYDWGTLAKALAERGTRVIAYDRVGYGHSDARTNDAYTIEGNARDLLALLTSTGLQDATVVGWSYGGATAMRAALMDSSRIGRLVLVGSAGPQEQPREDSAIIRMVMSKPVLAWVRAVPPASAGLQRGISEQAFSGQPIPEWWLPLLAANFAAPNTRVTYAEEGARYTVEGLDPGPIQRPILIVHGDEDRLAPIGIARWLHAHAPGSELDVVEGGSHMLPVTHVDYLANRIAAVTGAR